MAKKYLQGNREYKSDVFSMMLRIPENALDVYNAMNASDYTDVNLVEIVLLENGLSLSVRNESLLAKSRTLSGYMCFVNRVRDNLLKKPAMNQDECMDLENAIREAIDYCITSHVMEDFFRENRDEVMKNMLLDYTWERREELIRAEEYEDGLVEGEKRGLALGEQLGKFQMLAKLVRDGILSIQKAAEEAGMSTTEFENKMIG